MRIFLDFDGVLRRLSSPPSRFDDDCVGHFTLAVLSHARAQVIISSTWRLAAPLDAMRRLFPAQLRPRIEGVTPELEIMQKYGRHAEVRRYLAQRGLDDAAWIAVDDDPENFPPGAPLLQVDPATGFDHACARRLRAWLARTG